MRCDENSSDDGPEIDEKIFLYSTNQVGGVESCLRRGLWAMRALWFLMLALNVPLLLCVQFVFITRSRSRNFAKFGGLKWELPSIELTQICDSLQISDYWMDTAPDSQATLFKSIRLDNNYDVDNLIQGAKKCVLIHGLCEILADMPSIGHLVDACNNIDVTVAATAATTTTICTDINHNKISVCKIDNPYVTKQEIQLLLDQLSTTNLDRFVSATSQFPEYNELRLYVYKERILLGKHLVKGIAAPKRNEYHDPLPVLSSYRRNRNGILKDLAINTLSLEGLNTAMEIEIGLFMVNLGLQSNQVNVTVIDPFCGSCLLLLAAAVQCCNATLIGIDNALTHVTMGYINSNFRKHNFKSPLLYNFSAENLLENDKIQNVDAIVTDIPYEMKVQFLSKEEVIVESAISKQVKVDSSVKLLMSIATKMLRSRGRLVFFYPVRLLQGKDSDSLQQILQSFPQLTLQQYIPQEMSATFRRYLVVLERV